MAEIKLRDLQLTYDGQTLTISSLDQPEKSVALDPKTVEELVEFVHLLSPPKPGTSSIGGGADGEPSSGSDANRRESFRVPIAKEFGFNVELVIAKKRISAIPINVSMTGVFVEPSNSKSVDLQIGDEIAVRLSMNEIDVELNAIVRRIHRGGFGLLFPASIKNGNVNPPSEVRRIVMELQRRWMMMRKTSPP